MTIKYEPKDIYYPIIESKQRYLAYGSTKYGGKPIALHWYGITRALVIRILNEEKEGARYAIIHENIHENEYFVASSIIKWAIDSLRLSEQFCFVSSGEIVCKANKCAFHFVDAQNESTLSNVSRLKSITGLKIGWIFSADTLVEDNWGMINPCFREKHSKIIFSYVECNLDNDFLSQILNVPEDAMLKFIL